MRRSFNLVRRRASTTSVELLDKAKEALANCATEPSGSEKLELYGLFKVASTGAGPPGARPGFMDMVKRAKFDAWEKKGGLTKEAATAEYVEVVKRLCGGELPPPTPAPVSKSLETAASTKTPKEMLAGVLFPRGQGESVTDQAYETLQTRLTPTGVLTIILDRPRRGNAINMALWRDLYSVFAAIARDVKVRAVIITGNATSFCTGMDLGLFADMSQLLGSETCEGRKREALLRAISYFQRGITLFEECHVPTIACVSGSCLGGAIDLITACDLRMCTKSADFSVKEVDLAIVADLGTLQRLPRLIGDTLARDLAFTGRHFGGEEGVDMGLCVGPAFATEEEMLAAAVSKAETIAQKSPLTIRGIKTSMNFSRDHSVQEGLDHVRMLNASQIYSTDLLEASMKKPFTLS